MSGTAAHERRRGTLAPLNAAGFVTAFGAHSIAAGLGAESGNLGLSLLTFGVYLAVYDIAEVLLKPVFGSLSDRIGPKPVIVGGLIAFAVVSILGSLGTAPILLVLVRLGQGAAASAFSPAASSAVARLAGPASAGRFFGRYGSWKSLGYAIGPLIGAGLIVAGGFPALFLTLAALALGTAAWVTASLKSLPPLPRPRYTLIDVARQITGRGFLVPVVALAVAAGTLGVAVGFLPLIGTRLHMGLWGSIGSVTVLAISSAVIQRFAGAYRDSTHGRPRLVILVALTIMTLAILLFALSPSPITIYVAAGILGAGIGATTTLAFAELAANTPSERMGRTMGTAELGRELGDAGGPLLVGAVAAAASVAVGLGALALVTAMAAAFVGIAYPRQGQTR
ncbi:N/A [soil metagenome]